MSRRGGAAGALDRPARELVTPALLALVAEVRASAARVAGIARRRGGTGSDDPEAVHDFRVAVRRLRSVLRPVRRLYGRKGTKRIEAELKRIVDATSALRDEEALRGTLAALAVPDEVRAPLDAWMSRRARAEQARRGSVARFVARAIAPASREEGAAEVERGELTRALARLEKRLAHPRRGSAALAAIIDRALRLARAHVRAHADAPPEDAHAMHALRIQYKRLRYSAELFATVLARVEEGEAAAIAERRAALEAVAKRAARQQKRLGELHDLDEALLRIGRAWGLPERTRAGVLASLRAARARAAERAVSEHRAELVSWAEPG